MSFSGEVKEELMKHTPPARHCQLAELASILHFCGSHTAAEGSNNLQNEEKKSIFNVEKLLIQAENEAVIRKCFTLLKKTFNINTSVNEKRVGKSGKAGAGTGAKPRAYEIELTDPSQIKQVLQATKFMDGEGHLRDMKAPVSAILIKNSCCQRAFLRGAFLASGSMIDPGNSYHLDIGCTNLVLAEQIQSILLAFEVEARIVQRKKYQVVYMKDGTGISDFLNIVEAHVSLMNFENFRIVKEMRNSVNRRVNCETANIGKTVSASTRQAEDILLLQQKYGFENLPESLREMAEVRLAYPDAPLRELGEYLDPPVGKSGVNHRLRKLGELADKVRSQQGIKS
ncbi:MAG: DNA-binding protein WhiA [Eisenbergiella porci]|uniref:DNA-binding protein WhiA n=1 Tax=Eisenbergiella porci TaxID=2652274 RepID=UPI002A74D8F7|nr:DNA-binding protein WhiA [Eisenbergiella porci]MDY2653300.1 DNA-binding protein WhiA [Eisenbergiella porci]